MFITEGLFSTKGLISVVLCICIALLLRDYPQWRARRINPDKLEEVAPLKEGKQDNLKTIPNLSLVHYMLVTPFAAIYIVGRAILDSVRYSVYLILWSCEKSIPWIDDWLFDTITVIIPRKYKETEKWWVEKGQPKFLLTKNYLQTQTIPFVLNHTEALFIKIYDIGCILNSSFQDFLAAWIQFIDRHDWHQVMTDMGSIAHVLIWKPFIWTVTRMIKLYRIAHNGLYLLYHSLKTDIIWIFIVALPTTYTYIASTRPAIYTLLVIKKALNGLQWILVNAIYGYIIEPTIGRLLIWVVKCIDHLLVLLLQSHTIQKKLYKLYQWSSPSLVWIVFEFSYFVIEFVKMIHIVYTHLLHPAYLLFMKHIVPRLAIMYQSIVVRWLYDLYIYPALVTIYRYLNLPLFWAYSHLVLPFNNNIYVAITSFVEYLAQHLLIYLKVFLAEILLYTQITYSAIQSWLIKQAPVLSEITAKLLKLVASLYDWNDLCHDAALLGTSMYDWINTQSNLLYLSLERSLTNWAKEQQQQQK